MLALALPAFVGVVVGLLAGGRLGRWDTTRLDHWLPVCSAFVLQLVIFDPPLERQDLIIRYGPILYLASMVVVLVTIVHNARAQPGFPRSVALGAAAVGVLLNCLVVATNGGYMPRSALDGQSPVAEPTETGRLVNVTPMTPQTHLAWLGDVFAEPVWVPLRNVLSVGDLLLAGGLGAWAFTVTLGDARPSLRRVAAEAEALCPGESAST